MAPTDEAGKGGEPSALIGAAAALVAGIGALAVTGTLGRVQRNSGTGFAISIGLVVVGALAWVVAAALDKPARRVFQIVGAVLVGVGVIIGFFVAISSASDIEQPAVTLRLSADTKSVVGTVRVGELSSNDRLNVFVDGLRLAPKGQQETPVPGQPKDIYGPPTILYEAYVGPNGDGLATEDITVAIPPTSGPFDAVDLRAFTAKDAAECGKEPLNTSGHSGTGCAIIRLPPAPMTPDLSASLDPTAKSNVVKVAVRTSDVPLGQVVLLRAVAKRGRGSPTLLYRAASPASAAGNVSRDVSLLVPAHFSTVCVGAQLTSPRRWPSKLACPEKPQTGLTGVQLHMPDP